MVEYPTFPGEAPQVFKRFRRRYGDRKVLHYDPYNFLANPGDYMVDHRGRLFRLMVSNGRGKRAADELTYTEISPPPCPIQGKRAAAQILHGDIYWVAVDKDV